MMTRDRYDDLMNDGNSQLTDEELKEGWRFCACEWDGLLICAGDPEAKCCRCYYDVEGNLK